MSKENNMLDELEKDLWNVIQDYMELQGLIPDDNGGRMLCLVNEKFQKIFFKHAEGLKHSESVLTSK